MPKNWKTYKLEDAIEKLIDYRGKTPKKTTHGVPLVTAKVIKGGRILEPNEFISREDYEPWMRRGIPEVGDVVLTTEAPLGEVAQIKSADIALAQRVITLRGKVGLLDSGYLKYFLQSNIGQSRLEARQSGTTVFGIKQTELRKIEIDCPSYLEQRAIASILSALDDKIENNLAMNKTLEDMAMALYKHWFVDFGPFQEDKFIDSELGKIPEGWEVKSLDEVAIKKSESFNFKTVDEVVFVNTGDVQEGRFLHSEKKSKTGLPGQAKKAISKGDILYSEIRPKNKRYAFVNFDSSDYVVSTKFMIINPKENILNKLLYRVLTMQSTVDNFNSIAEGRSGTFPQITFDAISDFELILPPLEIQRHYQKLVSPMEMKQDELYSENQTLTQLRDTLLPILISGEVRLKEFEKEITAAL